MSYLLLKYSNYGLMNLGKIQFLLFKTQLFNSLFFRNDHLELPENKGEKRESLVILEKVGLTEGLL